MTAVPQMDLTMESMFLYGGRNMSGTAAFIIAALLTFGATRVFLTSFRRIACRRNSLDKTSIRNVHRRFIPRVGGAAMAAGIAAASPILWWLSGISAFDSGAERFHPYALPLGVAAVFLVGLMDDLRSVSPRWKFLAQSLAAVVVAAGGYVIRGLDVFGWHIPLGFAAYPVTVLFIVGVINAINLIDGLDGLAGGAALSALLAAGFLAGSAGDGIVLIRLAAIVGALVAFLSMNRHPAKIFLGDAGSLAIGLFVAAFVIRAYTDGTGMIATPAFLLPVFLPVFDTATAMLRRHAMGFPIFSADNNHIHHRIFRKSRSQWHTVGVLWSVCVLMSASSVVMVASHRPTDLAAAFLATLTAMAYLIREADLRQLLHPQVILGNYRRHRRAVQNVRREIKVCVREMAKVRSAHELDFALSRLCPRLDFEYLHIVLNCPDRPYEFSWGRSLLTDVDFMGNWLLDEVPVRRRGEDLGTVNVIWAKDSVDYLIEKRLLVEQFALETAAAIEKVLNASRPPLYEPALRTDALGAAWARNSPTRF